MSYLLEFIKGILLSFGIIAGFIISVAWFIYKTGKEDEYEADSLIKPFEIYLERVNELEHYEQIKQVENIIAELKSGKVVDDVKQYKIKKDASIHMNDEDGKTALQFVYKYIVIKKIEQEE